MSNVSRFVACFAFVLAAGLAVAQPYPSKAVRIIVPFPPGAGVDIVTRAVSGRFSEALGQQLIIDNRAGAGGILGAELATKAAPDGYTLLMGTAGMLTVIPHLNSKAPYSVERDFSPVSQVASVPSLLVVHPSLPVKSVKDLITLAKAKPGAINYASTGNGTLPHLAAEFFKLQARVDMVHVPYKGSAPATTDLLGGNVEVFFGNMLSVIEQVRSGRLRALAVTSLRRQAVAQDIPTMVESGFPGFEAGTWFGLLVPARTPRDIINRLQSDVAKAVRQPDVQKQLAGQGATTIGSTPEEFAAYIKSESAKWAKVLAASGVKAD
ncbi:MAG: tripartite tricarboxylate transporter substrate binding protein [Betaproteobacteria bacterium]|nr:tripartite tricarboxylate transporter substrate binding protein [Betaproteobacteria bacterium]MDH5343908.1 tripartite tricarboxylate transporter substrate binding protein [Betaproteobacteria bacterium]